MELEIKNKFKKLNNGITLISLVITIVIMLILATVAINLIIGNNGLFNKSKLSSEKYSKEAVKEELQTISNSVYLDDADTIVTNEMIANSMQSELDGLEWKDKSMLSGIYKGYDFYIDENKNVIMEQLILSSMIMKNTNSNSIANSTLYNAEKMSIKNITIKIDPYAKVPENAVKDKNWDVSMEGDGSIIAYFINNGDANIPYDLYIVGKKKIKLPEDSSCFFAEYRNTENLNGLENFDTSNVTDMHMFFYYLGFNYMKKLDLGDSFDTSKVTTMQHMFCGTGYKQMTEFSFGSKFDTSNVENMRCMFYNFGHDKLTKLDLSTCNFNTSKVTNMSAMFEGCGYASLSTFKFGDNFNTENVTNMSEMFYEFGYGALGSLDFKLNFNTKNVTDMNSMFIRCGYTCLSSLDLSKATFNTVNTTNMRAMFAFLGYLNLSSINLGNFFSTSKVTDFSYMFRDMGYTKLTSFSLGSSFYTTAATNMNGFFYELGGNAMNTLDLGTAFNITLTLSTVTDKMFTSTGKSGSTIYCKGTTLQNKIKGMCTKSNNVVAKY